jgi:VCBS repeat-containing protein
VSLALGKRTEIDGANSFQQVAFNSTASGGSDDQNGGGTGGQNGGGQQGGGAGGDKDDPPVAGNDAFGIDEDSILTGGKNLLDGSGGGADYDPDGFGIVVTAVNGQTLNFGGGTASVELPSGANLLINQAGDITYDPDDVYDFLGLNDTDTDVFTYTVQDKYNFATTATVTITVTGRNDQPELTQVSVTKWSDAFTEQGDTGNTTTVRNATGAVTFLDIDASDTHTATAAPPVVTWSKFGGGSESLPEIGAIALNLTESAPNANPVLVLAADGSIISAPGPVTGQVGWTYSVNENDLDFLADGETLTLVYKITVTDDSGVGAGGGTNEAATVTRDVTVTITGTNDVPVITAGVVAGTLDDVPESADDDPSQNAGNQSVDGSISFHDVDLTDRPVATEALKSVTWIGQDGNPITLTPQQIAALDAAFSIDNLNGNTNDGTVNWDYTIPESDIDFLGAGETVTLVYTITVTDRVGATDTQDVTVIINGASATGDNDAPVITIVDVTGGVADVAEAATVPPATNAGPLNTTGSITFSDVDQTDRPVATEATKSVTVGGGALPLTPDQQAAIEDAFTIENVAGNTQNGTVTWDYTIAESAVDFLGAGETVTVVYTITVTDDEGETDTQDVTIVITGANDAPVITTVDVTGDVSDVAEGTDVPPTSNAGLQSTEGSITFADVDQTDRPVATEATKSVSWTGEGGGALTLSGPQLAAIEDAFTIDNVSGNTNGGTVDWTYAIDESSLDFLGEGETVTAVFTITVTDDEGATDTRDVTVTITGANDAPVITAVDVMGAVSDVAEEASVPPASDAGLQETSGSITFADVDQTDRPVATFAVASVTPVLQGGGSLTTGQADALKAAFSITPDGTPGSNTNNGTINWTYSIAEADLDFLAAGETVTLVYTITVTDDEGATDTQDVTITVTGANDAPVISVESGDSGAEPLTETNAGLSIDGTLTVTELDLTNSITTTVESVSEGGTGPSDGRPDNATLAGMLTLSSSPILTDTGTVETQFTWTFDSGSEAFDYLGDGETLELTYTVNASDGTASDDQTVVITITGTNDAPVISLEGTDSAAGSLTETNAGLTTSGTLTVTELDRTDDITTTVTSVSEGGTGPVDGRPDNATLAGMLTLSSSPILTDTGTVETQFTWTFDSGSEAFDYLGDGETLELTYTVNASDGTASDDQTVVVTITGTNDAPVISLESGDSGAEALTETDAGLNTSGTLTVTELDRTDDITTTVVSVSESGSGPSAGRPDNATLAGMLTLSSSPMLTDTGTVETQFTWTFDSDSEAFDYLADGETLDLTYTVNASDGTASDDQTVVITITGTNDAPVISLESGDSASDALTETNDGLTTSGTLTVTELDRTDDITTTVTSVSESGSGPIAGRPDNATLAGMLTLSSSPMLTDTGTVETQFTWTFDSDPEAFDYLGDGETLDLTYTVNASDGTASDDQTVVITITGTNDAPVISLESGDSASDALTETNDGLTTSGTLTVTELDRTDDITTTVTSVSESGSGPIAGRPDNATLAGMLTLSSSPMLTDTGTVETQFTWTFDSDPEAFDYLGDGETLDLTYTVNASDGTASDDQTVVITITGTNDAPVISLEGTDSAAGSLTETNAGLTTSGTLTVTELDRTDDITTTVTSVSEGGTGPVDGRPDNATLAGMLTLSASPILTDTGTVETQFTWTFDSGSEAFDYLGDGETLELTYTVNASDGTASDDQTVVITVTGTNDAPVISLVGTDSAADALTETDAGLSTSGTLTVTELDRTDDITTTVTSVSEGGTGPLDGRPDNATLAGMLTLSASPILTDTGTVETQFTWTFDSGSEAFDYLGDGETLELTYTVNASDGTASDDQTVVITITGKNDAPVVTSDAAVDYDRAGPAVVIDAALLLDDVDSAILTGAFVSIGDHASGDVLTFADANGITGSYNSLTGVLELSGDASVADYQAALRSVTFETTASGSDADTRTMSFLVVDGAANSLAATSTVSLFNLVEGDDDLNVLTGSEQADRIYALGDDDTVNGLGGNDWLFGGAGDDHLFGGDGDDLLTGGDGADELTGGAGADQFIFLADSTGGPLIADTILDFDTAEDAINLDDLLDGSFNPLSPQSDIQLIEGPTSNDSVLQVNDGTGWTDVAVLNGVEHTDTITIIYDNSEQIAFSNAMV